MNSASSQCAPRKQMRERPIGGFDIEANGDLPFLKVGAGPETVLSVRILTTMGGKISEKT